MTSEYNQARNILDTLTFEMLSEVVPDNVATEIAKGAVHRNFLIEELVIRAGEIPDELDAARKDLVRRDKALMVASEGVSQKVFGWQVDLNSAIEKLENAREKEAVESGRLVVAFEELNRRYIDLQDRLKEHALNKPEVREAVWDITGGRCFYCDVELVRCATGDDGPRCFHVDHIVPKTSGGPDHLSNYVPACRTCNIAKGGKSYIDFLATKEPRRPRLTVVDGGLPEPAEGAA